MKRRSHEKNGITDFDHAVSIGILLGFRFNSNHPFRISAQPVKSCCLFFLRPEALIIYCLQIYKEAPPC